MGAMMAEKQTCPKCGYRRHSPTVAGNYEVCCGCLSPIYVQDDLTFRAIKLAEVPDKFREMIVQLGGEEV